MNIDNLSESEVVILIRNVKHFLDNPQVSIPLCGTYEFDENVQDPDSKIKYKLHARRGNLNIKYSIHIRFSDNNLHLVRLCINGPRHTNKLDNTKVSGNHLHIYDKNDPSHNHAYELEKYGKFISTDDLGKSFDKFLRFNNIIEWAGEFYARCKKTK